MLTESDSDALDQVEQYRSQSIASTLDPTRSQLSFVASEQYSFVSKYGGSFQSLRQNIWPTCLQFKVKYDTRTAALPIRPVKPFSSGNTGFTFERLLAPNNFSGVFFVNMSNSGPSAMSVEVELLACNLTRMNSIQQYYPQTSTVTAILEAKSTSIARVPATFVEFEGTGTCGFSLHPNVSSVTYVVISFFAHVNNPPPPPPPLLQPSMGVTRLYVVEFSTTLLSFQFDTFAAHDSELKKQPFIIRRVGGAS